MTYRILKVILDYYFCLEIPLEQYRILPTNVVPRKKPITRKHWACFVPHKPFRCNHLYLQRRQPRANHTYIIVLKSRGRVEAQFEVLLSYNRSLNRYISMCFCQGLYDFTPGRVDPIISSGKMLLYKNEP